MFFLVMTKNFGNSTAPYHCITILFLTLTSGFVFKTCYKLVSDRILSYLLTLIFLLHSTVNSLTEITFVFKYGFPLLIFSIGLYIVLYQTKSIVTHILYFIALACSILSHEGSLHFPYILIVLNYIVNRKISYVWLIHLIPSVIYILLRVFIWNIPDNGYMEVSLMNIPMAGWSLLKSEWGLQALLPKYISYFFMSILFSFCCYSVFNKKYSFIFLFLLPVIIALPFTTLVNHFKPERILWLSVVPSFMLSMIYNEYIKTSRKRLLYILILLSITIFQAFSFYNQKTILKDSAIAQNLEIDMYMSKTKEKIIQIKDRQFIQINFLIQKYKYWNARNTLLWFVRKYPNRNIDVTFIDSKKESYSFSIYEGSIYFLVGNIKVDIYGYRSKRIPRDKKVILDLGNLNY
jgi:hypothetical protein